MLQQVLEAKRHKGFGTNGGLGRMSDKEMYTAEDTQREIELLNRPSKQVTWSPFPRVKIELVIPPTVYPPRHDSDLLAQRISKFGPGRNKKLLEIIPKKT